MDSIWKHHPDIRRATELAEQYYDTETLAHAKRVCEYIKYSKFISKDYHMECICLALMHDLLEDTEYVNEPKFECEFSRMSRWYFDKALQLLTRPEDMDYKTYIKRMKESEPNIPYYVYECVWWVKLADIKDHLVQKDTLTDSLRDRYMWALSYLL